MVIGIIPASVLDLVWDMADTEDLAGVDGIHFGAIVLDGQAIMADSVMADLVMADLDTTLSGLAAWAGAMIHSGVDLDTVDSDTEVSAMVDLAVLVAGADGILITQDTGIPTDQFTMAAA